MKILNLIFGLILPCLKYTWGQTYTECDPLQRKCTENRALGTSIAIDFRQGPSPWFTEISSPDKIQYNEHGIQFNVSEPGDNPTIQSNFYIMFGRIEVILKAAHGKGIVSSFVLQSDALDEIDMEWIGGDSHQYQSNYFSKGDTTTFDRGEFHNCHSPQSIYHNYTVDWKNTHTSWLLDGTLVRLLPSISEKGYPQTPMLVRIGSWAGGDINNPPGTIEWAGGITDYDQGPFIFTVQSLLIEDYSSGMAYLYGDQTGDWASIQAIGGTIQAFTAEQFENDINLLINIPIELEMNTVPGTTKEDLENRPSDIMCDDNHSDRPNIKMDQDLAAAHQNQEMTLDRFESKQKAILHIGAILNDTKTSLLEYESSNHAVDKEERQRNATALVQEQELSVQTDEAESIHQQVFKQSAMIGLILIVIKFL